MQWFKLKNFLQVFQAKSFAEDVVQEIELERLRGERLSAWIQFIFVLITFTFWLAGRKGYEEGAVSFEILPYLIAGYLPLMVLRIFWSHKNKVSAETSVLFVILDVALLMAIIWGFHIQYSQSASFYLRIPAFGYLFVIIAIRVLTLRLANIIAATVSAIVGWSILILFAARVPHAEMTHNFVEYTLTHKILLGVEFEKLLYLLATGVILGFAVFRQSLLLTRTIESTLKADNLVRFFSPEVTRLIVQSGKRLKPGQGEKRHSAVLMIDLRGFSSMAQSMEPDAVMELLTEYHERTVPLIFKHNGCIDKFMGDGILAHFGAATPSITFAADCLNAVNAVHDEMERWNQERVERGRPALEVNSSCCVGLAIFGAAGGAGRLEYTIIGAPVNLAAKLEKFNKIASSVSVTTLKTVSLAKEQGFQSNSLLRTLAKREVPGIDGAIDVVVFRENKVTLQASA